MRDVASFFMAAMIFMALPVAVTAADVPSSSDPAVIIAGKAYVDSAMTRVTELRNSIKPVGFSGSYNDLTDKPAALENIQSDFAQTDSAAADFIKNKPVLADVATSGSFNDLSDVPPLPYAALYEVRSNEYRGYNTTVPVGTRLEVPMDGWIFRLSKISPTYQWEFYLVNDTGAEAAVSTKYDQYYGGGAIEVASQMALPLNNGSSIRIDNNVGYGTNGSDLLLSYIFDATNRHAYRVTAMFYIGNVTLTVEKLH